jgi:hypothetical protein
MPSTIINRDADNWRPLLAVADAAGGEWSARARQAANDLVGEHADDSRRVQLLIDIRAAFETKNVDRLSSDELVADLTSLDDRPWVEFSKGRALTKAQLARLVRPLGVSSGTIRLNDGRTPKGYYRRAFDDAFARYLPAPPLSKRHNDTSQAEPSAFTDSKTPHGKGCGASKMVEDPCVSAGCGGVADSQGGETESTTRRIVI